MRRTVMRTLVPLTPVIRNSPLEPVWAPRLVPSTATCAAGSGCWVRSATTLPAITPGSCCATSDGATRKVSSNAASHDGPDQATDHRERASDIRFYLHAGCNGDSMSGGNHSATFATLRLPVTARNSPQRDFRQYVTRAPHRLVRRPYPLQTLRPRLRRAQDYRYAAIPVIA